MPRSSWKGYLKLSLVSCAVALYNASSASERVSFNNLNRKTGNRLKHNLVDSVTGEPVDTAERVKGYQVAKGQYVMVEDTEIEALKIESTRTIEIETFVPQAEVDQIYVDSPYYLAPDDKVAEEAFAVIREAMTKKKMVGIGRIVLARRERMLMLQPRDKGMLATTLRYPYEVRAGNEIFDEIGDTKLPAEMLDIAQEIINRMSGHFEPETFTKHFRPKDWKTSLRCNATRQQSRMLAGSPGSRSNTNEVGQPICGARASRTCFSMSPKLVAHTRVGLSLQRM